MRSSRSRSPRRSRKPIACSSARGAPASRCQVGQVERFNPTLLAVREHIGRVKFVEAHRLALFQPRSLDIDVVFDLMIHDIDIVLQAIGATPELVSAVGVAVLSDTEDIANARLEFANGCVANLTASRVSQERLRRIRFFQDDAYLSLDLFEKRCDYLSLDRAALAAPRRHPLQLAAAIQKHDVTVEPCRAADARAAGVRALAAR
jgi:predicted dehydrogenase